MKKEKKERAAPDLIRKLTGVMAGHKRNCVSCSFANDISMRCMKMRSAHADISDALMTGEKSARCPIGKGK